MTTKKILLILLIAFYFQIIVKAQDSALNSKNTSSKTIIRLPTQQEPGSENIPLFYNTSTTRIEIVGMNNGSSSDSLLNNSGNRWSSVFGTNNNYDAVYDLILDYDNGYYIVGYDVASISNGKGWNIKTNINGGMLWDQKLVHPQYPNIGWCGYNDTIGNKYIAGVAFMDSPWPFLTKLNSCSEKLWCTLFKDWGYLNGAAIDMLINEDGNIIVLTRFEDSNQQVNQIFLLCYNPDGDLLWAKPYASKNDHPLISFAYGTKLYRFGTDYIISGYCYYPYPDDPSHVWMRPMFIGIDSQFKEKWMLPFGVSDSVVGKAYSVIPMNDSVMMGIGSKYAVESTGYRSCSMMFFNKDGQELGYNTIDGDSIEPGTLNSALIEIESINDSLFLATAVFGSSTVFNPFGDMVIDTSGKVFNAISRSNTTGFSNLIKTHDNKFVIACNIEESNPNYYDILLYKINENLEADTIYTQSFVYDSLCPDTIISGDIDMSNCTLQVGVDEVPTPEEYYARLDAIPIKAYPNPAGGLINLSYQNTDKYSNLTLHCYNAIGEVVHNEPVFTNQQGSKISLLNWKSGIYIAVVSSNGKVVGKVKFAVK